MASQIHPFKTIGQPRFKRWRQITAWAAGTVCSVATSPSTVSAPSIFNNSSGQRRRQILGECFPKKTDPLGTGGVWTQERIGLVCKPPSPALRQSQKSVNHQQDKESNDRFSCKKKSEPVLTASRVLKEHPFEIKQEDEVPELAAAIRECGIWPHHRSFAVFWSRHQPEIGLVNLMWLVEILCLEVLSSG